VQETLEELGSDELLEHSHVLAGVEIRSVLGLLDSAL
jgi:hypothetical protein